MNTLAPVPHRRRAHHPATAITGALLLWTIAVTLITLGLAPGRSHTHTRTITRTRTITAVPASARADTQAGVVAAFAHATATDATGCGYGITCYPPGAYPLAAVGGGQWELGYRILAWQPGQATVQGWYVDVSTQQQGESAPNTVLTSGLSWGTSTMRFRWNGSAWIKQGATIESPNGPVPPADGTTGPVPTQFARQISGYYRFPGAP